MRTASPGRKPNSASRRPNSAGAAASAADNGNHPRGHSLIPEDLVEADVGEILG